MKKYIIIVASILTFVACNSNEGKKSKHTEAEAKALKDEVMEGHDIGMAKTPKISQMQKEVNRILDSIGRLPAKSQEAVAGLKGRLDSLRKDLDYADFAMNKWMEEFNYDTATKGDLDRRVEYLVDEKMKVNKVKDAILNSLAKADSVLRSKL